VKRTSNAVRQQRFPRARLTFHNQRALQSNSHIDHIAEIG
jgi:hypothetical protein